jgi:CDP-diacylglycerol--glycerol-3-phosphate 3-phosphatidyltransferase
VTGLRMVAAVQGTVIPASKWGKAKTASQMAAIAALIIEPRWLKPEWTLGGRSVTWYLVLVMLVLTVVSGVDYFLHARQWLQEQAGSPVGSGTDAGCKDSGADAGTDEAGTGGTPGAEG